MKRFYLLYILGGFLILSLSGCWTENLKNCWDGDVSFHVMAERFQVVQGGASEDKLSDRIENLRYYLYHDNVLLRQGVVDSKAALDVQQYVLTFPKLDFGNYTLALLANVDEQEIKATEHYEDLLFEYPGMPDTKDYFVSSHEFVVDCECGLEDFVMLYRAQGVIQFKLKNLPKNITEVEIELDKLSGVCGVDTTFKEEVAAGYRIKVADIKEGDLLSFVVGSFPTVTDDQTEVVLKLYADGDSEFLAYEEKIGEINILRNQLVRINADFKHNISGNIDFGIQINPAWDGIGGGDVPVE